MFGKNINNIILETIYYLLFYDPSIRSTILYYTPLYTVQLYIVIVITGSIKVINGPLNVLKLQY